MSCELCLQKDSAPTLFSRESLDAGWGSERFYCLGNPSWDGTRLLPSDGSLLLFHLPRRLTGILLPFQNPVSALLLPSSLRLQLFSRNFALSPRAPKLLCTGCSSLCEQPEILGAALHKQSLVEVVQLFFCPAAKHLIPGELPAHSPFHWWWELSPQGSVILTGLVTELLLGLLENETLVQKKPQPWDS